MTVTTTELKILDAEVTCIVDSVESGVGYMYYGNNSGQVRKYNIATEAITTIKDLGQKILSMTLYSSTLYIGLADGTLVSVTTS
ncbi:MAG: hypothetical protein KKF27_20345 [Gammaproteobacteria bacterium]|nr:hypothetical protein [Gammaproteobacteria bacterium]